MTSYFTMSLGRITILLVLLFTTDVRPEGIRVCEIDLFHLSTGATLTCPEGQVLQIEDAFWGRANSAILDGSSGTVTDRYCPSNGNGDDQQLCPGDPDATLAYVQGLCQDKETCTLRPVSSAYGDPCPGVYKYLEVTYSCKDLQCKCSINATTLELDVFDEPDLMVYSTGQKTILSSYKLTDADPCKFKFQSVTVGPTAPAPLVAVTFNIGVHPRNDRKTAKSYKMWGPVVKERGLRKKDNKVIDLPYCWNSTDYLTQICIERVGDIIQFRSSTCQYALDVDVSNEKLSGATLYVDQSDATELIGMCGDCDGADNGYVLYNGTSVDNISDITERYQLITESYLDWVAKRSKRSQK